MRPWTQHEWLSWRRRTSSKLQTQSRHVQTRHSLTSSMFVTSSVAALDSDVVERAGRDNVDGFDPGTLMTSLSPGSDQSWTRDWRRCDWSMCFTCVVSSAPFVSSFSSVRTEYSSKYFMCSFRRSLKWTCFWSRRTTRTNQTMKRVEVRRRRATSDKATTATEKVRVIEPT